MNSIFGHWKNRWRSSNKGDNELKNLLDRLLYENHLFQIRFDKLDERYQQWIADERIYLLNRIEKLEYENHQLHQLYQTYQIQNSTSIQSITNLILQILLTQKELRKPSIERHNVNDPVQWRKKQQQDETITRNTRSLSCHFATNQSNDSRYTINDQSIWFHQVKEHDQKTRNYSLELTNHSPTLAAAATVKSKSEKSSAAQSNKLYYVLSNEKTVSPAKSNRANQRSTGAHIVPVDDTKGTPQRKQQTSVTFNKNQSQTRSTYSNHPRLPTQTSPIVKTTPTKTTTTTRPRPPPPTNQKPVPSPSTSNKPSRPRCTLPKPSEPPVRSRPGQTTTTKPNISPAKNIKTRIPIVSQQTARATDLDVLIAEQQTTKPNIITPSILIQPSLFSKNTVKRVRTVRSQELKLFTCHLTPEIPLPTNDSLSTLTPSSFESIKDHQIIQKSTDDFNSSSNISDVNRDFSEDSLNEHYHIQKILEQNTISTEQRYLDDLNPPYAPPSSLIKPKPISSLVHRLVFPERLGRLIFYRRTLSDSDIYQKNCSKDQEIHHNVYHLDTIRDYSMEFYMLTTYASDSQLRAWVDDDNDMIDGYLNKNRFLSSEDEVNPNARKISCDSLIQEELDWCSELELLHLTQETTSSEKEFLSGQQISSDSTSTSWSVPAGTSNHLHSTPLPSDSSDQSNQFLREILDHSWPDHLSVSNSIEQETGIEQFENDSTSSSIITDEFQRDFYYLCPISKTTSFSKT